VQQDVTDGYVSIEAAFREYGVFLDPQTFEVDVDRTTTRRDQLARVRE
jgi:hypothetical protein